MSVKQYGSVWTSLGTDVFSKPLRLSKMVSDRFLAVDSLDKIWVVSPMATNELEVVQYYNNQWLSYGNPGGIAAAEYPAIAIDGNNNIYVAYIDDGDSRKLKVSKLDCTDFDDPNTCSWASVGTSASDGRAENMRLKITKGANPQPVVAFEDRSDTARKLTVMKFDGTSWSPVGAKRFSLGRVNNLALAIDINNTLTVAYQDYAQEDQLVVLQYNGTAWVGLAGSEKQVPPFLQGDHMSLNADSEGNILLAFQDDTIYPDVTTNGGQSEYILGLRYGQIPVPDTCVP